MNINWNAQEYTNDFSFVHEYGQDVLNLLDINNGTKIVDLGCGNGALTKKLYDRGADVTGIDASSEMLEIARETYPELKFIRADAVSFKLESPADAVFSNAVFHWIDNQDKLLENISANLKQGGQLVCEFGGKGCTESIHSALENEFDKRGLKYKRVFYFPTIGEYTPIMERHGLRPSYAVLFNRPTKLKGENGMENWIRMFVKEPFKGIDKDTANEITASAVNSLKNTMYIDGQWYADYVRIRIKASRID